MPVLQSGELVLYGFVGDNYWDEGFTAQDVLTALAEIGRDTDILVRVNSPGGYTDDGIAIYNALMGHKGTVTIQVDAMAASAASIIAMAGTDRIMRTGALMMIHDPASVTFGTADDHEKSRGRLDKLANMMAGIYADRTGEDEDQIRADMRKEIWLTGDEAVERGFATATETAKAETFAAFDYRIYAHAPQKLKRLAQKNSWSFDHGKPAAASATAPTSQKEEPVTDKLKADAAPAGIDAARTEGATAAKDRIKAIMQSAEADGRADLASHFAYDTEIPADAAIAALAKAPKAVAPAPTGDGEATSPTAYEQGRVLASGLAQPQAPGKPQAPIINRTDIFAARRQRV